MRAGNDGSNRFRNGMEGAPIFGDTPVGACGATGDAEDRLSTPKTASRVCGLIGDWGGAITIGSGRFKPKSRLIDIDSFSG